MHSHQMGHQTKLAELVADRIIHSLHYYLEETGYQKHYISESIKNMIEGECKQALASLSLSITQQEILNQANLSSLADNLVGEIKRLNKRKYNETAPTALIQIYYDDLSYTLPTITAFLIDVFYASNARAEHIWYVEQNDIGHKVINFNKLKGDPAKRHESILSLFGNQLLQLATLQQLTSLCVEMKQVHNEFIVGLRQPQGLWSLFFDEMDTERYLSYENQLFALNCCAYLVVALAKKHLAHTSLPLDVSHHILSFFSSEEHKKLNKALPILDKEMKRAKDVGLDALKKSYRRH